MVRPTYASADIPYHDESHWLRLLYHGARFFVVPENENQVGLEYHHPDRNLSFTQRHTWRYLQCIYTSEWNFKKRIIAYFESLYNPNFPRIHSRYI